MKKSRAEICKHNRRRLKERNNDAYLRKKVNKDDVIMFHLNVWTERQRKTHDAEHRCQMKKKQNIEQENRNNSNDSLDTSWYDTATGACGHAISTQSRQASA
jgi:hypothetical protein